MRSHSVNFKVLKDFKVFVHGSYLHCPDRYALKIGNWFWHHVISNPHEAEQRTPRAATREDLRCYGCRDRRPAGSHRDRQTCRDEKFRVRGGRLNDDAGNFEVVAEVLEESRLDGGSQTIWQEFSRTFIGGTVTGCLAMTGGRK